MPKRKTTKRKPTKRRPPAKTRAAKKNLEVSSPPPAAAPRNGNGSGDPFIVPTLRDVAEFFGVAVQTVKQWRVDASDAMPGTPGAFHLRDVARWRMKRMTDRSPASDQLAKLEVAKKAQELKIGQVKLKKLLAEVIDVDVGTHLIERVIVEHNALAGELSERIRQMIPTPGAKIGPNDAEEIADNVEALVGELRSSMAGGIEEWNKLIETGTDGETENENEN